MKVHQLLETTEDENILHNIATAVQQEVINAVAKESKLREQGKATQKYGQDTPFLELGKLGKLIPSKTLGKLHSRLRAIPVEVDLIDSKIAGSHDPELRDMHLTYSFSDLYDDSDYKKKELHSTIVHELRHALDTSKSKGSAYRNVKKGTRYHEKRGRGTKPDADSYKANFNEINARTSEAMILARNEIDNYLKSGQQIETSDLKSIIFKALEKKDVTSQFDTEMPLAQSGEMFGSSVRSADIGNPLDNKHFRMIFNRMLKYAQQYLESKQQ